MYISVYEVERKFSFRSLLHFVSIVYAVCILLRRKFLLRGFGFHTALLVIDFYCQTLSRRPLLGNRNVSVFKMQPTATYRGVKLRHSSY